MTKARSHTRTRKYEKRRQKKRTEEARKRLANAHKKDK